MSKSGGMSGYLLGGQVRRRVGALETRGRPGWAKESVSVLVVDTDAGPTVGLEITHATLGSWRRTPVSMTGEQAARLAEMIHDALRG